MVCKGDALNVMLIVVGNEIGDPSSNSGRNSFCTNSLGKDTKPSDFPSGG